MSRRLIVLNGCCGVGKTAVGRAVSDVMRSKGVAHVAFDPDAISDFHAES